MSRVGTRLRLAVALLIVLGLPAAAAYRNDELRWRLGVVALKVRGKLPDIRWSDLAPMLEPGSGFWLAPLLDQPNPYAVIRSPYSSDNDVRTGKVLFHWECEQCHGSAANGGSAPALVGRDLSHDYDTIAAIRDRVGSDVKIRIDANMNWSVPAAVKWIRALEPLGLQFVEQPIPDFDLRGLAQVRRAVETPIAADEACTTLRSALDLIREDACDIFVVYPSEAGGLTRACQIAAVAAEAGKWCVIGSWAELGVATMANVHVAAASSNFPFASDTHYPLQLADVLVEPVRIEGGRIEVPREPGLGVALDPEHMTRLASLELRESPFYDDIKGDAPRVGQIL